MVTHHAVVRVSSLSLDWLALAAASPGALAAYYRDRLGLDPVDGDDIAGPPVAASFETPPDRLVLRDHRTIPSGGVHTHFAVSVSPRRYDAIATRLRETGPLVERTFGGNRSLYRHDPAGHCVEFGERDGLDGPVGQIFEVVLEVADLDRAVSRYRQLGFEPIDGDPNRPRRRLGGPFDLELWEPHLGIDDARGGCHVDLGVTVDDPAATAAALADTADAGVERDGRLFVRDPDGHTWWLDGP